MRPREKLLRLTLGALLRQSLRRGLRGVWVQGTLPPGALVLASNHHSWWDGYLLPALCWGRRPLAVVMGEARLEEFAFFRHLGALPAHRPRQALAWLAQGGAVLIFPEGALRPPGSLGPLQRGAVWLAQQAGVPLVPVATRVVLRGHEFPEAYLVFGPPLAPDLAGLNQALGELLAGLDEALSSAPPEEALPGFTQVLRGRLSTHERLAGWGWTLGRLVGGR